jgi:hypothetical protein
MGVADAPDIANCFGIFYENKSQILEHPQTIFYGRYIDDCFALVYADDEQSALHIVESRIKFDGCTIEWSCSGQYQVFLDMLLYKNEKNLLEHKPYRKSRNHMERVPWISHHPLDVKRGTFLGEMSRLATLSSTKLNYKDAMQGLVSLYVSRGYPQELVMHWLKENYNVRWEKRLSVVHNTAAVADDVLVLKTEYNTAWNWFHASEFGDTILGYWREYCERYEAGKFNHEFPPPIDTDQNTGIGEVAMPSQSMSWWKTSDECFSIPDIRKINILDRRIITSRRRTKNLFDFTSLWKKLVLTKLDEHNGAEILPRPAFVLDDINVHYSAAPRQRSGSVMSEDDINIHRRSPQPQIPWLDML